MSPPGRIMMSARSTPNLQQAPSPQQQQQGAGVTVRSDSKASVYSYLHTQSGLNFAPLVQQQTQGDAGSPPPAPPVRDASSLKCIKYGPGHEKFPSWPVSAAADTPQSMRSAPGGGSHRSKSWTDHTNYPKEKGITYTRPYMKRPNPAFTQQVDDGDFDIHVVHIRQTSRIVVCVIRQWLFSVKARNPTQL